MKQKLVLLILSFGFVITALAQQRQITGTVLDSATNKGLAGASIMIKNSKKGVATDASGKFAIAVPANNENVILVVSNAGYNQQEIEVGAQNVLTIVMTPDLKQLSDVVVIGYGAVKKKDLTGAVASIKSEDIVRSNPTNAEKAMQGQFAGVNITKASNLPGQAFSMDIRGENTITGVTEPLVVIDGVMGGRIEDINPADIQSIDILKDASSTAIYGSRGANGVVIITSKKGSSGKAKFTVDAYFGQKTPAHLPDFQTAQQFYQSQYTDVILNNGTPATFSSNELEMINSDKTTDWVDEITRTGIQTGTTAAVSGGFGGTTYRFSGGFLQEDGTIKHTSYKRYSLNGSVDSRINSFIRVGFTAFINYSENPRSSLEALRSAYRARPTGVVYYDDLVNPSDGYDEAQGPWNGYAVWMGIKDNQVMSPVVEVDPGNARYLVKAANQMGNAYAEITLLKGLSFKSSISASNIDTRTGDYRGTYTKDRAGSKLPRANYSDAGITSWTFDNQLTYNYSSGKSKINATALQSAFKTKTENYAISVQNLPFASLWHNLGSAGLSNITALSSDYVQNTLQSYMGRINYTYDDKYIVTLTGRGDGASQLANGNKWAFFPSGAFAWRVIDENFMANSKVFSDLKLRLTYGQVGNSNVSPYSTQAQILNTVYSYDQLAGNAFAPGTLGNKDLKWERSEEVNLGLDMGFFNNRLTATVELYKKNTKDLILEQNLPTSTGFEVVTANVGKISNKGIEVLLNSTNIRSKDFSWRTTINFSKNINRIEALANGVDAIIGNSLFVGESVKSYYDYKFTGIWQIADSSKAASYSQLPGQVKVIDKNGDGVISSSTDKDDRMVLGSQLPNYTIGMTNYFTYKNFDLSFFMYYRNGTMFMNGLFGGGTMADYTNNRYNHIVLNYWTRNNPTNDMYGVGVSQPYKNAIAYQIANFLRVSDITVGYTMPGVKLKKYSMDKFRVYLQVTNPFIFTKYKGMDPEYNSNTYVDDVPNMVYTLGLSIGF
ncbi:SusC/RagA family TonB-linked outer membrane protein [Parafilimonas terrae]|uniref:TonB-linked outer membrane protein, SusC/RagA family n=1 Tax=Parafilimonas terrae TaxID=1465490 RepID=A0A1I5Y2B3_9BACT|nr:TonB-dependent receptor [Parafilimonas terrae]SFQ38392.1 TonB-linked outer membrane protein, SusC/RagA family [Parafilimonas terrae]